MAEIPSIPSVVSVISSSATVVSGSNAPVTPVAPVADVPPPPLILAEALVRQAPPTLTLPVVPVLVAGRVISSTPSTQEIRIRTAAGEVVVQSSAPLPPGVDVSVEVYTDKNKTLTNIAVEQKITKPPLPSAALSPLLREGARVTAMLLPAEPPVMSVEKLAGAIELLKKAGLEKVQLPLPADMTRKLLSAPDIRKFLEDLPPRQFRQVSGLISLHEASQNRDVLPDMPDMRGPQAVQMPARTPVTRQETLFSAEPAAGAFHTLLSLVENIKLRPALSFASPMPRETIMPQNMYQMHILKILPPNAPPEQIKIILQKSPLPHSPQKAEVESVTSGGFPILKTEGGHFVVKTPVSVPVGSVILFDAAPMTPEQILAGLRADKTAPAAGQPFDPGASATWPALEEALKVVQQANPAAAEAFRNAIPAATPQLVPTALFFLAALRLGSVDSWLGDNTLRALREAGKKDLAETLGSDFTKIFRQSKEVLADEWRSISIPLLHDDQVSQMQFYVRQQNDGKNGGDEGDKKTVTRFLLNLHLSRMGEMQLDGFIQKKRFDIVLRTAERLPFDMRQALMQRFASGLEQVQMQGAISFQASRQGWVTVESPHQRIESNI